MLAGYPLRTHNITPTRREKLVQQEWINGEVIKKYYIYYYHKDLKKVSNANFGRLFQKVQLHF